MDDDAGGGAPLSRGRRGGGASSPPRGALDGIRKDHERAKLARASGETLKSGTAWSNGAALRARGGGAGSSAAVRQPRGLCSSAALTREECGATLRGVRCFRACGSAWRTRRLTGCALRFPARFPWRFPLCAAFLNQKSWHPLSYKNQKALWVAQQAAASAADTDARAREEFESEQEYFKCAQRRARAHSVRTAV
jgi:hypothetical protein